MLIAHPDDECIFFTPTLISLSKSYTVHLVSFSSGNYSNLGYIRREELVSSGLTLDIHPKYIVSSILSYYIKGIIYNYSIYILYYNFIDMYR